MAEEFADKNISTVDTKPVVAECCSNQAPVEHMELDEIITVLAVDARRRTPLPDVFTLPWMRKSYTRSHDMHNMFVHPILTARATHLWDACGAISTDAMSAHATWVAAEFPSCSTLGTTPDVWRATFFSNHVASMTRLS